MLTLALALMIAAQDDPDTDTPEPEVSAERARDDRAEAARLIGEGNALLDQDRPGEALKRFSEAYDLFGSPTILLSLAEAHLKLGNDVRAAEYYQRFLEEKAPKTAAKLVMLAEQRLEELAADLAVIKLETTVEGALVSLGDDPIGETPMPPQYLKPGLYRLSASKEGHVPFNITLDLAGGETRTVTMPLTLVPAAPPPKPSAKPTLAPTAPPPVLVAPPPEPEDDGEPGVLTSWWFWTTVGAVVAAGVTVGVVAGTSGGDSFVPGGELGLSGTSSWQRL